MEWERKMDPSCVDFALHSLELQRDDFPRYPRAIYTMILGLRFFKMFFWGLAYEEDSLEEDLYCTLSVMRYEFREAAEEFSLNFLSASDTEEVITNWETMSYHLEKTILLYKEKAREICMLVLNGTFKCKSRQSLPEYPDHADSLIDLILENLRILESTKDLIAPIKQQIYYIKNKLKVFGKFAYMAKHSPIASDCLSHISHWAYHISCLVCIYWIDEIDESRSCFMEIMLSDLMHKYMPYTPKVISLYIDTFKSMRCHKFESDKGILELPLSYVDYLLEHLITHKKHDSEAIEILCQGLICLLSFSMDPFEEDSENKELILAEIDGIMSELPYIICTLEADLSGFLHQINNVKALVRKSYVRTPLSSVSKCPQTDAVGSMVSLLGNLKKILERKVNLVPFIRDDMKIVHDELVLLQPFLQVSLELDSDHKELRVLQTQIMNLAYFAEYITKLGSSIHYPLWYSTLCLPNLIGDLKLLNSEVMKIMDDGHRYNHVLFTVEMDKSSNASLVQATTSTNEGVFIGFENDVTEIRDHLVRGPKNLTIISISGMSGQGKTTLARKIYNDPSIHYYFHKKAWCHVSKECNPKTLLENIARDVSTEIDTRLEIQDLIESLWRILKGNRYFIVLDDIWDVDVWRQVRGSFPNDGNGSRILFTSRNHDLASEAEPNSIAYHLRPFSDQESWELMNSAFSNCDHLPREFSEIGKRIAHLCNGLPLAVTLVVSVLKRAAPVLDQWEQVAENLISHLAGEGCMPAMELSYKYLPDHLKPCFLYFGAFPRNENIRAQKLKLLWIAEGFVKENGIQCSEDLAKEYLDYLVSQSLVVTERSSRGGIKWCRLRHDLLNDLCFENAVQDNFLDLANETTVGSSQGYGFHQRLCINKNGLFTLPKPTCTKKELPTCQIHTLLFNTYSKECETLSRFLGSFKVLTVMDLEGLSLTMFPDAILYNIHLRYLAMSGWIRDIPASIANLWNLETLIVDSGHPVNTPNTLWEMESLKYVHIQFLRPNRSSICRAAAPIVEVLRGVYLKYDRETVVFLGSLMRLRKLKCFCDDEGVIHPMWFSMFGSLEKLNSLNICCFYYGESPVYQQSPTFNFPDNLKKLTLERVALPWSAIPSIGKLPNLEVLKLQWNACVGTTWHLGDEEFRKLRYLKLEDLDVEQIDDSGCEDPFPCLGNLFFIACWSLVKIPLSFGDICTLDTISVSGSGELWDSVRKMGKQQRDRGNNHFQVCKLNDDHADEDGDSFNSSPYNDGAE